MSAFERHAIMGNCYFNFLTSDGPARAARAPPPPSSTPPHLLWWALITVSAAAGMPIAWPGCKNTPAAFWVSRVLVCFKKKKTWAHSRFLKIKTTVNVGRCCVIAAYLQSFWDKKKKKRHSRRCVLLQNLRTWISISSKKTLTVFVWRRRPKIRVKFYTQLPDRLRRTYQNCVRAISSLWNPEVVAFMLCFSHVHCLITWRPVV